MIRSLRGWKASLLTTAVNASPPTARWHSSWAKISTTRGLDMLPTPNMSYLGCQTAWNVVNHRPVILSWRILFAGFTLLALPAFVFSKWKSFKISNLLFMVVATNELPEGEKKAELIDLAPKYVAKGTGLAFLPPNLRISHKQTWQSKPPVANEYPFGCKLRMKKKNTLDYATRWGKTWKQTPKT